MGPLDAAAMLVVVLVIRGGRVVDPGSSTDRIADVLVADGRVRAVGPDLEVPDGTTEVAAHGMVVGPGFVDLHSHVNSVAGQRLQAFDGVTTALDLESGLMPVERAYREAAAEGRPLNYGFSASWAEARGAVLIGSEPTARSNWALLGDPGWQRSSSPVELDRWLGLLEAELADGALGIGILQGYAPRTDPHEFLEVARLAARAGTPTFTHVREIVEADPTTPIDGSLEIVAAAAETGATMHHCHVNSTSRRHIDRVLALVARSKAEGSHVSLEMYPYGAGGTAIGAAFLAPDLLSRWDLTPSSIVLLETGERIGSVERLEQLRAEQPGADVVVEFLDETQESDRALLHAGLAFPDSIVASDALAVTWPGGVTESREWPLPPGGVTHPRTAGTYAKAIRTMVRERGTWTWLEAFRRCSYLPARVVDEASPAARGKGHLGVGADADIVVLDPDRITDRATYAQPTVTSEGVRELYVGGVAVIVAGELVPDAYPGRPVKGAPA